MQDPQDQTRRPGRDRVHARVAVLVQAIYELGPPTNNPQTPEVHAFIDHRAHIAASILGCTAWPHPPTDSNTAILRRS